MIRSFTMRGGINPWRQGIAEWDGQSEVWTVTNTQNGQIVYMGTERRADLAVTPESVYFLTLTDDDSNIRNTSWVSSPVQSPRGLRFASISSSSATATWARVPGTDQYEVRDSYTDALLGNSASFSYTLTGLEPDSEYSVKVRALVGGKASGWSSPLSFRTAREGTVEPGVYEFMPYACGVYSYANGWLPWRATAKHGDGFIFGDADSICTTEFYYPDSWFNVPNGAFKQLDSSRIVEFTVFLRRFPSGSDPRSMLSHWGFHQRFSTDTTGAGMWRSDLWPPSGPSIGYGSVDSGMLMHGEGDWIDLPISWAQNLCSANPDTTMYGITWGGVTGRYQTAAIPYGEVDELFENEDPPNGTLRIVVA